MELFVAGEARGYIINGTRKITAYFYRVPLEKRYTT